MRLQQWIVMLGMLGAVLTFRPAGMAAQSPAARAAVPSKAAQAAALDHLRIVYKDEYAKAKTDPAARAALAAQLLQGSRQAGVLPGDRYVRLREARNLAAQASDPGTAFQAAEEMAEHFRVNVQDMKLNALTAALPAATSVETNRTLAELALTLVQEQLDHDGFERAFRLNRIAAAAAAKTIDRAFIDQVARGERDLLVMRKAYALLDPAKERLRKDPEDPQANLEMGKYLGLVKGDWKKALFYLAQGNDAVLRRLAQHDLAQPDNAKEQLKLAEAWWKLAEKAQGSERVHLQQHAVTWYEQAIESTHGFQRGRLEERIASVPRPYVTTTAGWDYNGRPGEIRLFTGHTSTVYGVAFTPDGRKVLSGGVDNRAALWDIATGKQLLNLQGHGGMIWSVAVSPDGRHVFTASWDGTVKMWETGRGTVIRQFPAQGRITDINGMALSRDGKQMLTGSDDGAVRLWDVASGQELRQLHGHRGFVYGVAFSPDGRALSGGSADNQMILWDLQTGKELHRFAGLQGQIRNVAFSPDGRTAVNAGWSHVTLWNVQTGEAIRQFRGHQGTVNAVAFSPDGRRLATGASDRTVRLWDVATGRELHRFDGHTSTVFAVAFSPGGGRLVSGGQDNTVRVWGLPR